MKLCSLWMLALGAAALMAQDGDALLKERLERNPAWKRAQQTPAYDAHAPSGFVLDEAEKARQRAAGEELKRQVAAAIAEGRKEFRMAPHIGRAGQYVLVRTPHVKNRRQSAKFAFHKLQRHDAEELPD